MKKIGIIIVSIILILAIGFGGFYSYLKSNEFTLNKNDVSFAVDKGSTFTGVANKLQKQGIIKSAKALKIYSKIARIETIRAGNYVIKSNMNVKDLLSKLSSGKSDFSTLTIPEGYSFYQIGNKIEEAGFGSREAFLKIKLKDLDKEGLVNPGKNIYHDLEGYLFPDTYFIPVGATEAEIAQIMFNQFKKVFNADYINRAKELNLSINEVMTIASLIEKEAANDKERKTVSGVIYNRLKIGMPLQIDASVIYAITKGEKNITRVLYKDLETLSPFNTYKVKEMPPGPIAAPGKASIEAALYPEKHDYYYYVLGNGGHVFSKTYAEHVQNVSKYRK